MPDFLLEIGLEEVPARMINSAEEELGRRIRDVLQRERLAPVPTGNGSPDGRLEIFSTPRRLAVLARDVAASQPDLKQQVLGPSVKVSFKDGKSTAAAEAFARKVGVAVDTLERVTTAKGEYLAANVLTRGRPADDVLAEALPKEILALHWAKNMYWRGRTAERFVRPVRWLVALLDDQVVPMELAGKPAQAGTRGHRILGRSTTIPRANAYAEALADVKVIVRRSEREHRIRKALDAAARAVPGARWREDAELLNTVVNLTEWPSVILGNFDREFLSLPEEVLVTVMRDHQKYFAVEDASGKLAPHFLAVLNTEGDPEGIIRHGNERVLRARFNDARFFWQTDQKRPLRDRVDRLKNVTFQKDLGSYYDKTLRVQHLASRISQLVKDADLAIRPGIVHKAALLAKADLTTELVKEFTELQGIVGGLYAKAQGLDPAIGDAIYDHYKPESMEDRVPRTVEAAVLSIADKADTIAGLFALGYEPSGSKDPFALRRQANGIIKTIAERGLPLKIADTFKYALAEYPTFTDRETAIVANIYLFLRERVDFYLREVLGFEYDTVRAVMAATAEPDDIVQTIARAKAVTATRGLEDFAQVSIAFKRIKNILGQAKATGWHTTGFDPQEIRDDAEKALAAQMPTIASVADTLTSQGKYTEALLEISKLRPYVDAFFDKVMVMVPDKQLRENRLALLTRLLKSFSTIADFSEIVTESKTS
ncbi:MAG TPA: glycine--tRNA ligase subunit beta [Candidatus Binatia bacterium]|nr:glycine--tRNA ligase subunit beta [Candidatus Binatia bacterium]